MKVYPVFDSSGARVPIFQIERAYVSLSALGKLLTHSEGVRNVRLRRPFAQPVDVHVQFEFFGRPYIVWEPWGDNSRYWVGPADMRSGTDDVPALPALSDIAKLETPFERYRPPLHRNLLGDLLTLKFITRTR